MLSAAPGGTIAATVLAEDGGPPLEGAAFIIRGAEGTVVEGTTDTAGRIFAEVGPAGAPYALTVAAPERGARSIVDIRSSIEASLTLSSGVWPDLGPRTAFRVVLSNLGESERSAVSGAGTGSGAWTAHGVLDFEYIDAADQFSLFAIIYEQQWISIDGSDVGLPFRREGNEPLRLVRGFAPSSMPFPSEVLFDVSTGESPTVSVPIEIRLPNSGAYRPRVRELVLYLIDNLGRDVGRIETTPEHGVLMVPPVMGPVLIEGEDVSDLRFSANAPDWSSARVELVQQQEARRRTVRWVVTSTVGALATTTLPALPSDMTVASIGFDTAASCQARIELQHWCRTQSYAIAQHDHSLAARPRWALRTPCATCPSSHVASPSSSVVRC